jgi:hypothetical protein
MQGNPLVPLAQQQLAGQIGGAQATALQGQFNPLLQSTITGSYLNPNPYLTQALQPGFNQATQSYQDAINQMRSKASASGRYGMNEALMSQEARAQGALANALTSQAGEQGSNLRLASVRTSTSKRRLGNRRLSVLRQALLLRTTRTLHNLLRLVRQQSNTNRLLLRMLFRGSTTNNSNLTQTYNRSYRVLMVHLLVCKPSNQLTLIRWLVRLVVH